MDDDKRPIYIPSDPGDAEMDKLAAEYRADFFKRLSEDLLLLGLLPPDKRKRGKVLPFQRRHGPSNDN